MRKAHGYFYYIQPVLEDCSTLLITIGVWGPFTLVDISWDAGASIKGATTTFGTIPASDSLGTLKSYLH